MIFDLGSIPVDRTTKIGCPFGHPIFVFPEFRQELRVELRTRVSVLPYETKKTVFTKAKQTIDNRLAGRAAKGAIPVDRTRIG